VTYSIVARDPETGELGAAVQSRSFGTGRFTIWVESDVGSVATQSFGDPSYGSLGLELLRAGKSPERALAGLVRADELSAFRQVAFVDATGKAAAHTGQACIPAAGHLRGEGFSVQGNMLASEGVWPAMASAFTRARGTLAERLLAALEAAQEAGGDWRGQQAGALLVAAPGAKPWERVSNLRVDDHPEPVAELRRLLSLEHGYRRLYRPPEGADVEQETAAADAAGLEKQDVAWAGLYAAMSAADADEGKRRLETLLALDPRHIEVVRRRRPLAEFLGIEAVEGAP
jgi:uncharacterized Ntn-hydrolase superfamily protein